MLKLRWGEKQLKNDESTQGFGASLNLNKLTPNALKRLIMKVRRKMTRWENKRDCRK